MQYHRHITLPNDVQATTELGMFVDEVCENVGFDMSTALKLNLAIEEAVVNVMSYAYPAGTKGDVDIDAEATNEQLKFVISDSGTPFDPTTKGEVDTTLSAEERDVGGLGVYMVKQTMDDLYYEYRDGQNQLTLIKTF